MRAATPPALPPLSDEGEVFVYLQPFPDDAERLALVVAGLSAARADGTEVPLQLQIQTLCGSERKDQRLLALGRLPPGTYNGLLLQLTRATLTSEAGPSDLLLAKEPVRIDVGFSVRRGAAVLLQIGLRPGQTPANEFGFAPTFSAGTLTTTSTVVQLSGYVSSPDLADLFVFDRRSRQVTAAIPTGREPTGVALDSAAARAYVALTGEDQVQVLDLAQGVDLYRIRLRGGDSPREIVITPDGRTLLTVNPGSNSASFLDPVSSIEVDRVLTGDDPWTVFLERTGRRAYVMNRRSNNITVVDVATHAVVATIGTDPEPLRAQVNRNGDRLYVIHRGSQYMNVYSVPDYALLKRTFVGLGAGALKVDPRTDLVYVGRADEGRIQVFDPFSLMPIDTIEVSGPVSYLTIDDTENTLLALVPSRREVAFVDLTTRRIRSVLEVGQSPYWITVVNERF
jgi:YVTN family beta-propeller protein